MSDQLRPYKKGQEEDNNSRHMGELCDDVTSFAPTRRDKSKITIAAIWVSYVMSDQLHPYEKGQEEDNNSSHMGELCDE